MPTWLGYCSSCNFLQKAYDHLLKFSNTFPWVGWSLFLKNIPISKAQCLLEAWDEWFPLAWFDAWTLQTMLRWLKSEQYEVKQFVFCSSIDNIFEKSLFWANAVCKNDELFALLFVRKKGGFQAHWSWNLSKSNKVHKFFKKRKKRKEQTRSSLRTYLKMRRFAFD